MKVELDTFYGDLQCLNSDQKQALEHKNILKYFLCLKISVGQMKRKFPNSHNTLAIKCLELVFYLEKTNKAYLCMTVGLGFLLLPLCSWICHQRHSLFFQIQAKKEKTYCNKITSDTNTYSYFLLTGNFICSRHTKLRLCIIFRKIKINQKPNASSWGYTCPPLMLVTQRTLSHQVMMLLK